MRIPRIPAQTYQVEIRHEELHKYRLIKGRDRYVVEEKARAQLAAWDEMWEKKLAAQEREAEREHAAQRREEKKELALQRTREAEEAMARIRQTLQRGLETAGPLDWENLKDIRAFGKPKPLRPAKPVIPRKPERTDLKYRPRLSFWNRIFAGRRNRKIRQASLFYTQDTEAWKQEVISLKEETRAALVCYRRELPGWEAEQNGFFAGQKQHNSMIDEMKAAWERGESEGVVFACNEILSQSSYPDDFPKGFDLDYNDQNRMLVVDYTLPQVEHLPRVKSVKYVQTRDEFVETFLTDSAINTLYDDLLYQVALRSIHELYSANQRGALESVVFNGWVESVDKGTGNRVNACVLSVQANRDEFAAVNLSQIDPKACFKNLKGVGSSQLHSLTPVAPIIQVDRQDERFVPSHEVTDGLDDSYNLAAMDWEDFEHLIRELFEKEFTEGGGEVKVTRASRDGGVDAIAFDPDPIRGGKIVIQAKRYTNTVGVSAVRDLYGTVVNEGATKGVLVTTADYGPDAYAFAKGKPLTLLSGSNLLHLLEKHGHKAKIDLKEAKRLLAEQNGRKDSGVQ